MINNLELTIILFLCCICGFITNVLLFIPLCRDGLLSSFTTVILRCQFLFDGLVCCLLLFVKLFKLDENGHSNDGLVVDNFTCVFWYTQTLYWIMVGLSSHNLIVISVDRLLAIEFPLKYKTSFKRHFRSYIVYMSVVPQIGSILGFASKMVVNGTCIDVNRAKDDRFGDVLFSLYIWLWTVFDYMVPVIFPCLIYLRIFHSLKQLTSNLNNCTNAIACTRLVKPAFINTVLICIFRLPENIFTMMESYKLLNDGNEYLVTIFNIMVVLVSCFNPIIYYKSLPKLREMCEKCYHVQFLKLKLHFSRNVVAVRSS